MAAEGDATPDARGDGRVWLITGCSSGFGREIALAALSRGDAVVATARPLGRATGRGIRRGNRHTASK